MVIPYAREMHEQVHALSVIGGLPEVARRGCEAGLDAKSESMQDSHLLTCSLLVLILFLAVALPS
jgi:hypothetical protein